MRNKKGAFAGFIIGLLMVPGSIALHAWNEYRTIHRTHGLQEAQRDVVSIEPEQRSTDQDGKLVHLSGESRTEAILTDEEFAISQNAVHLRRTVEMYQWTEDKEERDDHTTYNYQLEWKEGRVDSDSFNRRSGHENPIPKFASRSSSAKRVDVGLFHLNNELRDQMQNWQPVDFGETSITETRPNDSERFTTYENVFYWSESSPRPDSPQIGDLKISFDKVTPGDVSFVAKLAGETFETYRTSNGEPIERLYDGILGVEEVFANLKSENTILAWMLRGLGALLCVIGVLLIFGPVQKMFSWIPYVGDFTGGLFFLAALLIGGAISLTTISISWIAVRPLMGIGLLVAAGLSFFLLSKLGKNSKAETQRITVTDDMLIE